MPASVTDFSVDDTLVKNEASTAGIIDPLEATIVGDSIRTRPIPPAAVPPAAEIVPVFAKESVVVDAKGAI